MVELWIDTATDFLFVALVRDTVVIDSIVIASEKKHSDLALYHIQACFEQNGIELDEVSAVCVGAGPGSYSGIRIARTIAKMLRLVRSIQCYQFSTLQFLHILTCDTTLALHAGRNRIYARINDCDQLLEHNDDVYTVFDVNYPNIAKPITISYDALKQVTLTDIDKSEPNYIKDAL